ncbi:MAG: magnesium-translocating P-type ATPase [Vicinamibacterales bacterium]
MPGRSRQDRRGASPSALDAYWSADLQTLLARLESTPQGLTTGEAERRRTAVGPNAVRDREALSRRGVLVRQLRSPLLLLLVFAAATSAIVGQWIDSGIVLLIVGATVTIGYSREYRAGAAAQALRARLAVRSVVLRDGHPQSVATDEIVPGDVVQLSAGSLVPADGVLLSATDLFVSEASLTGESFPVQKLPGAVAATAELRERTNCVFMGSNVRSGSAACLIVMTGRHTALGAIAQRLTASPVETDFDRGIRRFGYLLTRAMLVMVLVVFVVHVFGGRPPAETLLFAVALAVGLSPELLPAILSVNLARGAQMMARQGVLVRRLNAIENLGSMDVLCTDKTGTLTEGVVELEGAYDSSGQPSSEVLRLAACNAALETGIASPLDDAILKACPVSVAAMRKRAEIPFDFVRKRVGIVTEGPLGVQLIAKGAYTQVLDACAYVSGGSELDAETRAQLDRQYEAWTSRGIRVLAVAVRALPDQETYGRADERDLTFVGFLTFADRPKQGVGDTIAELAALGVSVKIITGDSRLVTMYVAASVGLRADRVLSGSDLDEMNDEALWVAAERTSLFVEVDPNQKERIILALKKRGHVVGFLGDGVNDAPAMHAADASLSVDQAVDVARQAADLVLMERELSVIRRGVEEGRRTFANTLKYILMTTSANLGNMVSMALASFSLPFLPLTAGQILLNNFLSDIPAIGIADDDVDDELVERPERWNMRFIGRYMVEFGALSSLFDIVTFALLIGFFHASRAVFQTGWFVESLLTELVVALVVRTRRPFYRSRPGRVLLVSTLVLMVFACVIPYVPVGEPFGFVPLPVPIMATIVFVTLAYVAATEIQKRAFYRREGGASVGV